MGSELKGKKCNNGSSHGPGWRNGDGDSWERPAPDRESAWYHIRGEEGPEQRLNVHAKEKTWEQSSRGLTWAPFLFFFFLPLFSAYFPPWCSTITTVCSPTFFAKQLQRNKQIDLDPEDPAESYIGTLSTKSWSDLPLGEKGDPHETPLHNCWWKRGGKA